ncbi:MAG: adenylate/guanylate cyclase domain-containing protein, partial [Casimicrobiaceae bacterium]
MGTDESGTLARLKAHRRELLDPKIAEFGGRIVKTTGDGLLLEFPSVVDAVRCAVDVQRGMAERNAGVPADKQIEFRIGVNVGDIIIDGDDIFGDGVNVAARLQALAEPGGICASRVVRDQVLDKLSFDFEDLGAQQVKNIARPVEVFRVDLGSVAPKMQGRDRWDWQRLSRSTGRRWLGAAFVALLVVGAAIGWYIQSSRTTYREAAAVPPATMLPERPSLAVLPFDSLGGSSENSYFADGMTDDI